jgi:hypothetical protein
MVATSDISPTDDIHHPKKTKNRLELIGKFGFSKTPTKPIQN